MESNGGFVFVTCCFFFIITSGLIGIFLGSEAWFYLLPYTIWIVVIGFIAGIFIEHEGGSR